MKTKATLFFASLTLLTGCIIGDNDHRLYIDPSGAVTWVVLEREVRSTSTGETSQHSEELSWLANAELGQHPVARAFDLLRPSSLHHQILRSERPYSVRTDAHFASIDELARITLHQLGLHGKVELATKDGITRLHISIDPDSHPDDFENDDILALAEDLERYRLVMTAGRFVEAHGFEIEEDGAVSRPMEQKVTEGESIELSLAWETR